ncbi:hypothetical protein [Brevundimonas subvibrioides]|uniref:hypothetical protein n=1 Tax=Brevundimonas subvibrioides TaxID=74313 RepID=UPI0022B37F27|nr:hypothetical protein [Brevundimonas subvibrioides]
MSVKPHGTVEAKLGLVDLNPGVAMLASLVWMRGSLHLQLQEVPIGKTPPDRPFRRFHIRGDSLPGFITQLQTAEAMIERAEGALSVLAGSTRTPAGFWNDNPNTDFSRARAPMRRPGR